MTQEITKIETQKKDPLRVSVFVDHKFAVGIDKETADIFEVVVGKTISIEDIEMLKQYKGVRKAFNYLVDLIYRQARTEYELRQKLRLKEYPEMVIDQAIEKCRNFAYINDQNFVRNFIETRQHKYGAYRIKMDLKRKGVSDSDIDMVWEEMMSGHDEQKIAHEMGKKRLRTYKGEERDKIYRKLSGYLARKGYSHSVVKAVVKSLLNDDEMCL